jgi:hypothetical protein
VKLVENRVRRFPWGWLALFDWLFFALLTIGFIQGNLQNAQYIGLFGFFGLLFLIIVIEHIYFIRRLTNGILEKVEEIEIPEDYPDSHHIAILESIIYTSGDIMLMRDEVMEDSLLDHTETDEFQKRVAHLIKSNHARIVSRPITRRVIIQPGGLSLIDEYDTRLFREAEESNAKVSWGTTGNTSTTVIIEPGAKQKALLHMLNLVESADSYMKVRDNHISKEVIEYLIRAKSDVRISLLTSLEPVSRKKKKGEFYERGQLLDSLSDILKTRSNIEIRITSPLYTHARNIITEAHCWVLDISIDQLGERKLGIITMVSEEQKNTIERDFDKIWEESKSYTP